MRPGVFPELMAPTKIVPSRPTSTLPIRTFRVLRCARAISQASAGAFDVTLGRTGASWQDIVLQWSGLVSLRRALRLDLGGIAKGFAVDCAVAALREAGATSGSVNAGGDLRLFGDASETVRVRLPSSPLACVPLGRASNVAFATSAGYFSNEVLDARTQKPLCGDSSITVRAVVHASQPSAAAPSAPPASTAAVTRGPPRLRTVAGRPASIMSTTPTTPPTSGNQPRWTGSR